MNAATCPRCGSDLAGETSRDGLCAQCLLGLGQEATEVATQSCPVESLDGESERIGPYRLLEKLGEGGMGTVWLAEQVEPVQRRVALKIIKHGMDTKQVVARFEVERQALAMMDHPCVAKVFDAGSTPNGRPYFAMEHVQGVPITDHCDRERLTTRARLELFCQVCEGVQHAHQKAIIHRDLKPSNVLVAYGDRPAGLSHGSPAAEPKIIDFGVAKATAQRLTEKTLFTEMGVLIGTPEYMSPEQAEMTGQSVDTRTDVYSLGVMLYELLTGALPFDPRALRESGFEGVRRKIREEEPSKPSMRLSTLGGDRPTESAKLRRTDLPGLQRQLRGDLDWITMRALEKDRARRYGSPAELAADVERHLKNQPVVAGPPSAVYRAGKFVRRHRVGVGAAVAGVLVLVAFTGTMTVQAGRIARERDRANREAAVAIQTSEFLENLFEVSDPDEARSSSVTARELLDRGVDEIRANPFGDTEVQARMARTMGAVHRKLGLYDKAEPLLEESLDLRRSLGDDDDPRVLDSMNELALLRLAQGRYEESEPLFLETLDGRKRMLGKEHVDTLSTMSGLADLYQKQGRYEESEALFLSVLEMQVRTLGDLHRDTLTSKSYLAVLYFDQGRYDETEPLFREVFEGQKRGLGPDHPDTLATMNSIAFVHESQGRYDEAETLYVEAIEIQARVLGEDHPRTLVSKNNLAGLFATQARYADAEQLHVEILATQRRVLGSEHPETLTTLTDLAALFQAQGRYADAEPLCLEALDSWKQLFGEEHPRTLVVMNDLANLYRNQGRYADAEPLQLQAFETQTRVLGPDHPNTLTSSNNLAGLYKSQGRPADAEPLYEAALASWKRLVGDDHPSTLISANNLAVLYEQQGRYAEAEPLLAANLAAWRRLLGDDHPNTLVTMGNLGGIYTALGRAVEAEVLLREAVEGARRALPSGHSITGSTIGKYGACLTALERYSEAEAPSLEAHEILVATVGDNHARTRKAIADLVALYEAWGKPARAQAWRARLPDD